MKCVLSMERHTLAREWVDDLFLDAFLTLGETFVLGERETRAASGRIYAPFLQP